jgi:hypothetical protein
MTTEIYPRDFIEKYKLVPKPLRFQYLEFLRQMPYIYDEGDLELDIFDDLMLFLFTYETQGEENYDDLLNTLQEHVFSEKTVVYNDVAECLVRYLQWKVPVITYREVMEYRKKQICRQIKEDVAYRPGNVGYEITKEHFESLF